MYFLLYKTINNDNKYFSLHKSVLLLYEAMYNNNIYLLLYKRIYNDNKHFCDI